MSGANPDETAFPRGGHRAPAAAPSTTDAATKKRNTDFLFGNKPVDDTDGHKKKKRRKQSIANGPTTSLLPVGGGGVVQPHSQKKEAQIEALSFSKLAKGTKLLGIVKEVHEDYAIVSLPNLLNGYILKRDKDQFALEDSLSAGQVLAVVVVKASTESIPGGGGKTRKRIQVSALPSGLNDIEIKEKSVVRGRITSVEDHGCLVDLGHHKTGFLPFDQVEGDYSVTANDNNEDSAVRLLNPGRLYDFVVSSKHSASTKVVPLSLLCTEKLSHKTASSGDYTLQTLNPGMLVQARVEALARNGICVTFLGAFRGAIELSHLGTQFLATTKQQDGSSEWKQVFSSKKLQKFPARILAVDPVTKVVRLTLLPHLLDMKTIRDENESLPPVGTVVENATVIRLDPGVGALLALPSNDDDDTASASVKLWPPFSKTEQYRKGSNIKTAYVHISKALDGRTPEAEFSKTFAPSTTHTLRILNTSHLVDGIATCATADSVVQAHVLTHDDLEPGKVYRNVVVCGQLEGGSVMVDFGMGIRGLIPQMHLFDHSVTSEFRNRLKKEKFAIGTKVDVKCLSVDALHKRCLVTAKKSLLKASDNITAYQDVEPGQTATGFISKIDDKGLCVTFCNRVYGKVTARSLAAELGVENHHADYHVGDVVQCRVINCKKRQQSRGDEQWDLNLSLNLHKGDEDEEMEDIAPTHETSREVGLKAGAVLPEKSMRVVELVDSIPKEDGSFIPGHAIVRIKSKLLVNDTNAKFLPHVECKLPFDQLQDSYSEKEIESAEALDALAKRILTVGKKVEQKGLILSDPKKSTDEYASGLGRLPIVSLRPMLIATAETPSTDENTFTSPLLPTDDTHLFTGAFVQGYVTQVNPRHGSFVRFLNRVTGLVPKVKKGLNLPKYGTVTCRIVALDTSSSPPKILLTIASSKEKKDAKKSPKGLSPPVPTTSIKPGDVFHDATVVDFNFHRARINLGGDNADNSVRARIHVTMAEAPLLSCVVQSNKRKNKKKQKATDQKITKHHPFYKWKSGMKLPNLSCVAVDVHDGAVFVELTNRETTKRGNEPTDSPVFLESISKLVPGMKLPAVITSVSPKNTGIWVQTRPGMSGFIPALELSTDAAVLNNMGAYFPLGARIQVCVMDKDHWVKTKHRSHNEAETTEKDKSSGFVYVSVLQANEMNQDDSSMQIPKPIRGDLIVGRINRKIHPQRAPALMLDLRGGFVGRCCITELDEVDDWVNMPLGRLEESDSHPKKDSHNIVTDEEHEAEGHDDDEMEVDEDSDEENDHSSASPYAYSHGTYVQCRVLAGIPSQPIVDVSLRPSRLEGDLDDDEVPTEKDMVQGYVVNTNKKGCFLRLSRQVEGRVILKELCDGFLHDPIASFPAGRLVVGKVKSVHKQTSTKNKKATKGFVKATVDLDMRESILLERQDKLEFEDIELQTKHKAVVTRLETYGVFVRLENSNVSGLVHKSECSDKYIKNLADLYDPGDLVKVLVVKKDVEGRKLGFSMKASHFEDDEDSENDSLEASDSSDPDDSDLEMADALVSDEGDDTGDELDSDDENFATKLAAKMEPQEARGDSDNDGSKGDKSSSSDSSSDSDSDSDDDEEDDKPALDTNVGFDWGTADTLVSKAKDGESSDDSSDESSDDDDDSDALGKPSHKSKRKAAARRREEQEIARREAALADGTADENPETAADFERLLASDPNRSEHWIRYMAYHLSLADIASARNVAQRAFDRIEFRQEGEKLNVWTALLTLELKYGAPKSFQETIDKACQHNNPKQVYLRVCEILEKELDSAPSSAEAKARADDMYKKMCKKFKSKKTVWLQHLHYLLKGGRHEEAHALLKRALTSLPEYKHVETMSKFAQLEMEHGSMERGRTIMDGLLSKYPKRLDLLFVYVDKEVKHGELDAARALFERKHKLNDKQMKSLFKKWYRIEEEHGTDESREHVKDAARAYVERSTK